MSSRPRIVIVGGGSKAWTPKLVRDMMLAESLRDAEFVLYDVDKSAGDLTKAFLDKLGGKLGSKARIVSTDRRAVALRGADYVIITISTGGLAAMAHDLGIPEDYGIYHTVGDTNGPGGWARFLRNFDVFVSLAEDFNRYCPAAPVLNYTNPMATLTAVLARLCKAPVVGLCHGLFENIEFLRRLYGVEEKDVAVRYAGLNHFFWITEARAGKVDAAADLKRRVQRQSLTDLRRIAFKDGKKWHCEVATELFRHTGVLPYMGDRHIAECFPWYITSKANLRKYKLVRTTIADRQKGYDWLGRRLREMVAGDIDEKFTQRSRETAADIIDAHSQGRVFIDVGNVPNVGQIGNLPRGLVVETAVRVDRNGFSPIAFGDLPEPIRVMAERPADMFLMVVEACFRRGWPLAVQALRADPLCSHLNCQQVEQLAGRLLKAHRKFISAF